MSEDLHAWAERWLDAANRHDLDALAGLLAPDVRRAHLPRGAAAWLDDERERLAGFPDLRLTRIGAVAEGDRLALHLRSRGTHRGPFLGVPATGRRVGLAEFRFLRVVRGRVVEAAGTGNAEVLAALRG